MLPLLAIRGYKHPSWMLPFTLRCGRSPTQVCGQGGLMPSGGVLYENLLINDYYFCEDLLS
jgi:hypothetical protein